MEYLRKMGLLSSTNFYDVPNSSFSFTLMLLNLSEQVLFTDSSNREHIKLSMHFYYIYAQQLQH